MQTQSVPGRIQTTRATYELLKDEFVFEARGTIPVKGKGEMETWYLLGMRAVGSAPAAADTPEVSKVEGRGAPTAADTPPA